MSQYKPFLVVRPVVNISCSLFLLSLFTAETFNGVLIGVVAVVTLILGGIVAVACALLFVWMR